MRKKQTFALGNEIEMARVCVCVRAEEAEGEREIRRRGSGGGSSDSDEFLHYVERVAAGLHTQADESRDWGATTHALKHTAMGVGSTRGLCVRGGLRVGFL